MTMMRIACAVACFAAPAFGETLTVYTYDSFVSDWGPGPQVEAAYEAQCGCDLELVAAGDGASILSRLKLEGARSQADVVLGLDTGLTAEAIAAGLVLEHGVEAGDLDLPMAWDDSHFLPYDWGYFAFVYDSTKVETPPASFEDLIAGDHSIVIQDPRTSTPGLGLMLWIKSLYGDKAGEVWGQIAPKIVTVTKGWDEAYGLFLEGEADLVLSYTTSPSYHAIAEGDATKDFALFDAGHYMQVEVAGIVAGTKQEALAKDFMAFMLSEGFQGVIPTTNWMFPAKVPAAGLPEGFAAPLSEAQSLLMSPAEAASVRAGAIEEWRDALSQ